MTPTLADDSLARILFHLDADDDPVLWRYAIPYMLDEFTTLNDLDRLSRPRAEIGRCSHWQRPHQTRWEADGGFAAPIGYGGGGLSRTQLPEFDWSVRLAWEESLWVPIPTESRRIHLRVALPSRTIRHAQAAVHVLWNVGREKRRLNYGFRKRQGCWTCTAAF